MNYPQQNKYKLVKNASNTPTQSNYFKNNSSFYPSLSTNYSKPKSYSFSSNLVNSSVYYKPEAAKPVQSNLLKQTIESSNKLDELLKQCRDIGTKKSSSISSSDSSLNSIASSPTQSNNLKPINNCNLNPLSFFLK